MTSGVGVVVIYSYYYRVFSFETDRHHCFKLVLSPEVDGGQISRHLFNDTHLCCQCQAMSMSRHLLLSTSLPCHKRVQFSNGSCHGFRWMPQLNCCHLVFEWQLFQVQSHVTTS